MDADRFRRIQQLFLESADLPEADQVAFLHQTCGEDEELRSEVLALIREDTKTDSLLDGSVAEIAGKMLGESLSQSLRMRRFGPYLLKELLGEGGMGVVYRAEREDIGSQVAIKFLRDAWMSPARRERFAGEQRTLAQLNHPLIARLYDAGTLEDGTPWFVMEYVEGLTITEFCRQKQPSFDDRLRLFREVCCAVQYAHEHAIIHRDLKPSNILVKSSGEVRLLDFGIAKRLGDAEEFINRTRTELRLLTPAYAAPEQIRGEPVGIFTDVYALGIILYELLAGAPPFQLSGKTTAEIERTILEVTPTRISLVALREPNLKAQRSAINSWSDLDVLCATSIHKDTQRRYRSVEALIRDIDHYLAGEPLEARPDSLRYRAGKYLKRNRRALIPVAVAVVAALALITFYTVRLARARNTAVAAVSRAERVQQFMLNLFQGGDSEAGQAPDSMRVAELLDRGEREAQLLNSEPEVQAALYHTLGTIRRTMGNLKRADSLLSASLARRESIGGTSSREIAESSLSLILLRIDQAKYAEAQNLAITALQKTRSMRPRDERAIARATFGAGKVLAAKGSYDGAIVLFEEAMRAQSGPQSSPLELSDTLTELANAHHYLGHYDLCESLNRRILELDRQLLGDRHPNVGDDLANLGAILTERGRFKEAERVIRQARDISQGWFGKDHPETAGMMHALGGVLTNLGRYDEARDLLEQALVVRRRVHGEVHPYVGNTLLSLANLDAQRGNLDRAESGSLEALRVYRTLYKDQHYLVGVALVSLGRVYDARKRYDLAIDQFQSALKIYSKVLPPDHQYVAFAELRMGSTFLHQKKYSEAENHEQIGYQLLLKKTNPPPTWMENARQDLVNIYRGLNEPKKAAQYQTSASLTTNPAGNP